MGGGERSEPVNVNDDDYTRSELRNSNTFITLALVQVMGSFLSIAGPILKSSNLFQSGTGKKAKSDEKSEFPGGSDLSVPTERTKDKAPMMPAFGEDEDEEEDDGGF